MVLKKKLTFMDLRTQHHFDIPILASRAHVDISVVRAMLIGNPVYPSQAKKVLKAFSDSSGQNFTLAMVDIRYFPEDHLV